MSTTTQHRCKKASLEALRRRLNALAYDQINEELARLDAEVEALKAENEQLRARLSYAEGWAESWREDAMEAMEQLASISGGAPGLTMDGRLVVVQQGGAA